MAPDSLTNFSRKYLSFQDDWTILCISTQGEHNMTFNCFNNDRQLTLEIKRGSTEADIKLTECESLSSIEASELHRVACTMLETHGCVSGKTDTTGWYLRAPHPVHVPAEYFNS